MATDPRFQQWFDKQEQFRAEVDYLRELLDASGMEQTVKWGAPTYMWKGRNVVGIGAFKGYVGLWFFQGALLADTDDKLMNAQEGTTRAMRQWRFQSLEEIHGDSTVIQRYLKEAMFNAEQRKEIKPRRSGGRFEIPVELAEALKTDGVLRACYDELTPGRQKEYAQYIAMAKREATRLSRLEKCIPMIKQGIGLNDMYRKA